MIGHISPPIIELIDPLDEVCARIRRGDYDRPEVARHVAARLLTVL